MLCWYSRVLIYSVWPTKSPNPPDWSQVGQNHNISIVELVFIWFLLSFKVGLPEGRREKMAKMYDYLFKLLLIGDSGVGKTCLLFIFPRTPSTPPSSPPSSSLEQGWGPPRGRPPASERKKWQCDTVAVAFIMWFWANL